MNITVICGSENHPVVEFLLNWIESVQNDNHSVRLVFDASDLKTGDLLFAVSYDKKIDEATRSLFNSCLVLHASDLPKGRGWSPHIWSVINGANQITVCLFEAEDKIDSGKIWRKSSFQLDGTELLPEINSKLFKEELALMSWAIKNFETVTPYSVSGSDTLYYPKRTPSDSRLDPTKSILDQFDLLRTVDNDRYPAFVEIRGRRYKITIQTD